MTATTERRSLVRVHALRGDRATEYHLTAEGGDAEEALAEAAAVMARERMEPMAEKLFGLASHRPRVMACRHDAYARHGLDPSLPVTWIEARPAAGGEFAGLQIWGVAPHRPDVEVMSVAGGRCWRMDGTRVMYLPSVLGTDDGGTLAACISQQAGRMFANASRLLSAQSFRYGHVVRTWIYLARILDWYGEFNRVRTAHHVHEGIGPAAPGARMPASTGIQGRFEGAECFMDVLAVDSADAVIRPLHRSCRQDPAACYGSGFSRGMGIRLQDYETIYVSGTASIDRSGRTVHAGDAQSQCVETLLNVAALLDEQGAGLEDICSATLYCRNEEAWQSWQQLCRLLAVPRFPTVSIMADVCRPDLLVELEAVASVP